jgi:hypothetical protein
MAARKFSSAVGFAIFIHQKMELEETTTVCRHHQHAYTLHALPKSTRAKKHSFLLGWKMMLIYFT